MDDLGLSTADLFQLLILGMGPVRVALAFIRVAPQLSDTDQRYVAKHTVLTGLVLVVLLVVAGGGLVRNFAPRVENVLIGSGLVLVVVTLVAMVRAPAAPSPGVIDPKTLAVTPLAVPAMINPVGVTLVFAQAAYVHDWSNRLTFFGLVLGILALNYVTLRLVPKFAKRIAIPILVVVQEIFSLLTVSLGVGMILLGLDGLRVISLR
jgi:small neutral amino acid transporter SnatA (MarC family)